MATATITYGVEVWLSELVQAGWALTVSERRRLNPALTPEVGVLAVLEDEGCEGSGVFIPCSDERCARSLLERVLLGEVED